MMFNEQCYGFLHTVRSQDSIYSLARQYGVTVQSLVDANPNVDPDDLPVGEQICIPERVPLIPTRPAPFRPYRPPVPPRGLPSRPSLPRRWRRSDLEFDDLADSGSEDSNDSQDDGQ